MRKQIVIIGMGAVLLLLTASPLGAQEIAGKAGAWTATIEKEYSSSPGGNLVMRIQSGRVTASAGTTDRIRVTETIAMKVITREEAAAIVARLSAAYRQEGETLTISGEESDHNVRHEYRIVLPQKFNLDIRCAGGDLELRGIDGRHEIETAGGDITLASISGVTQARTAGGDLLLEKISGRLEAQTSGGDISAQMLYAEGSLATSGGDIGLEKSTQRLDVRTMGGDIQLREIGGAIAASTSGGDITLDQFSGSDGSLNTMGGDLRVNQSGGRLNVNTSGGDIICSLITQPLQARTMGGDIEVRDLRAAAVLNSSGGDITAQMTLADFKVPHSLEAESLGGDIQVELPASLPAVIEAEILITGSRETRRRSDIYSDFPLSKPRPDETNERVLRSKGEINGGGDRIYLKTTNGDITIKKLH